MEIKNIPKVIIDFKLKMTMTFLEGKSNTSVISLKWALFSGKHRWIKIYFGALTVALSYLNYLKVAPKEETSCKGQIRWSLLYYMILHSPLTGNDQSMTELSPRE